MSFRLSFAFFACLAAASHATAAEPPEWASSVDAYITAEMQRAGIPGAQLAIAQDGRVVYAKAYGVADVETGRKVTDETLFQTGSVTKLLTAVLLAQLATE